MFQFLYMSKPLLILVITLKKYFKVIKINVYKYNFYALFSKLYVI